ncbi:hypothetical protein RHSIM_Rhsim12G0123900 [Rhododendron simsii]|uniref:Uncharacterized protein n=1 Tax=Rhododendron simsii TaxID=118357 RepID=A0A834G272_RHOSS|nr:hypothetical protein RHSIM_Rhsim12G0123900 [Rhododendron simsii]
MGNCQAVDAAALVIQHPSGTIERMYWSISANEVMKMNPGHYVSLIIPLPDNTSGEDNSDEKKTVRFTRVKLLRPTDTLVLGRAYRLVTSEGWLLALAVSLFRYYVMKVLKAKKHAKMRKNRSESGGESNTDSEKRSSSCEEEAEESELLKTTQQSSYLQPATRHERHRQRPAGSTSIARSKSWRPSLQSISEGGS